MRTFAVCTEHDAVFFVQTECFLFFLEKRDFHVTYNALTGSLHTLRKQCQFQCAERERGKIDEERALAIELNGDRRSWAWERLQ